MTTPVSRVDTVLPTASCLLNVPHLQVQLINPDHQPPTPPIKNDSPSISLQRTTPTELYNTNRYHHNDNNCIQIIYYIQAKKKKSQRTRRREEKRTPKDTSFPTYILDKSLGGINVETKNDSYKFLQLENRKKRNRSKRRKGSRRKKPPPHADPIHQL